MEHVHHISSFLCYIWLHDLWSTPSHGTYMGSILSSSVPKPNVSIFDRESISHGPTSLKIVVLVVLVATFVQVLHGKHQILHRKHEVLIFSMYFTESIKYSSFTYYFILSMKYLSFRLFHNTLPSFP